MQKQKVISTQTLKGSFLIAMPHMIDGRFAQSLVYLCEHSEEGAMGLIVNKPLIGVDFDEICRQVALPVPASPAPLVYYGGPVYPEGGFIIHSTEYHGGIGTLQISPSICLSTDQALLKDIVEGCGPKKFLLVMGYSGWMPGQLENEIQNDDWLVVPAEDHVIFDISNEHKWRAAASRHGIDLSMVSNVTGTA